MSVVNSTSSLIPELGEVTAPDVVRKHSAYKCGPITFRFKNSDNAVVKNPVTAFIETPFLQNELLKFKSFVIEKGNRRIAVLVGFRR